MGKDTYVTDIHNVVPKATISMPLLPQGFKLVADECSRSTVIAVFMVATM